MKPLPQSEALRTYLLLEKVVQVLDEAGDDYANVYRDMMDPVWRHLADEDRTYLRQRGDMPG